MTAALPHPGATARSAPTRPTTIELGDGLVVEATADDRSDRWWIGWMAPALIAAPDPEGLHVRVDRLLRALLGPGGRATIVLDRDRPSDGSAP
jgi:hypothetical protein